MARRERLFQRDTNHLISRRLVEEAQTRGLGLALEDLSGIRERTNSQPRTKKERGRANRWAFAQLRLIWREQVDENHPGAFPSESRGSRAAEVRVAPLGRGSPTSTRSDAGYAAPPRGG